MTPSDRVREARDELDRAMERYANAEHPSREYPHNQRKYDRDVADNQRLLDAYAAAIRAEHAAEIAALKDTVRSLNRRCQQAESAALVTVAECERKGVSLGRGLAGFAYAMAKREVEALKADGERLDWLEAEANGPHGLHLHDGTHAGCNGLGLKRLNRTLRDVIDAARASEPRGRE